MADQNNPYFPQTSPNTETNQPQVYNAQQPPYMQQNDSFQQYQGDQVGVPGYQTQGANLFQQSPPPQGENPYQQAPPPQQIYSQGPIQNAPVMGQPVQQGQVMYQPQGLYIQNQGGPYIQQPLGTQVVIARVLPTNLDAYYTPAQFQCKNCNQQPVSRVVHEPGEGTWLCCCGLCCLGGILGIIPFFVPSMQNCSHFCPVCGSKVGYRVYKPC